MFLSRKSYKIKSFSPYFKCCRGIRKVLESLFFPSQIALKCRILQGFISISRHRSFLLIYYIFAKKCKMKQITSVCSSQIVVSLGGADYCSNKFPNLINLLISLKCSAKIFLHFNHLTALHEHPYPIL